MSTEPEYPIYTKTICHFICQTGPDHAITIHEGGRDCRIETSNSSGGSIESNRQEFCKAFRRISKRLRASMIAATSIEPE